MSDCPKCGMSELIWTKTPKGKNWLKDQSGNWHTCNVEKKPELGEPVTLTNHEKKMDLRNSGGNLKPTENGDLLSENWIECMVCNQRNPNLTAHLVLKDQQAVNTHMDLFHKFDGSTKKECFRI